MTGWATATLLQSKISEPARPDPLDRLLSAAAGLQSLSRWHDAARAYAAVLHLRPDCLEARFRLGVVLQAAGELDQAIDRFRQVVAIEPDFVDAWYALGTALQAQGRLTDAAEAYRRAVSIDDNFLPAHINHGAALLALSRPVEAAHSLHRAVAIAPDSIEARANLAHAQLALGDVEAASAILQPLAALRPDSAPIILALADALQAQGKLDDSIGLYRRALSLNPRLATAHLNLGNALRALGQREEARAQFREAIAIKPDFAAAHFNEACELLADGNFTEGFRQYEWRLRLNGTPIRTFGRPLWSGDAAAIDGRCILLHAEQGLGDTLQFVRYAPRIASLGARIVLEVQPALRDLIARTFPEMQVVAQGDALPEFDFHCPLLSLPRVLGTTLRSVPTGPPYIAADARHAERWAARLDGRSRLKVGLVWAGNRGHANDRNRSLDFARLAPLLRDTSCAFYSLQVGPRAADLHQIPGTVDDLSAELTDFEQTAAALANLDLVLSVDTSVCHLAGAMGRPTWVLLPFAPDWRWLRARDDSPWYPTMRLFRQRAPGDWDTVVLRLARAIAAWPRPTADQPQGRLHSGRDAA